MDNVSKKDVQNKLSKEPHYAAKTAEGWGVDMLGLEAADGSEIDHAGTLGLPILDFTIEAIDILKARVRNKRGKWLSFKNGFGMNQTESLGDGTPITGIEILGSGFIFSIHAKGGSWLPIMKTSTIEGEVQAIAASQIDAIWVDKI